MAAPKTSTITRIFSGWQFCRNMPRHTFETRPKYRREGSMNRLEEKPLVSIGIPTYNRAASLRRAIESALAQDYVNLEVVISYNASTDETQAVCEGFARKDSRIRYIRQVTNHGAVANFRNALSQPKGEFSFHGSKTLTTGLVTDREDIYQRALFLRDHGRVPGDVMFCNTEVAYKYKMSNMQAALGLAQSERVEELVERKRQIFSWDQNELAGVNGVTLNYEAPAEKTLTGWSQPFSMRSWA